MYLRNSSAVGALKPAVITLDSPSAMSSARVPRPGFCPVASAYCRCTPPRSHGNILADSPITWSCSFIQKSVDGFPRAWSKANLNERRKKVGSL